MGKNKLTVGIFSRDASDNYKWLIDLLEGTFSHGVENIVIPVYVGNDFFEFLSNVNQCKFAILYHTQKRGRLNVTDVTDSLYDRELENLSSVLGKENVIVVLDDLVDNSDSKKNDIVKSQPKINEYSCDLLLISEKKKQAFITGGSDLQLKEKPLSDLRAKLNYIKKIMDADIEDNTGNAEGKGRKETTTAQTNQINPDEENNTNKNEGVWSFFCCFKRNEVLNQSNKQEHLVKTFTTESRGQNVYTTNAPGATGLPSEANVTHVHGMGPDENPSTNLANCVEQGMETDTIPTATVSSQIREQEKDDAKIFTTNATTHTPLPFKIMWESQADKTSMYHGKEIGTDSDNSLLLSQNEEQEKKNDTPTITNHSQVDPPSETSNPFSPTNMGQKQEQGRGADKNKTATSVSSENEEQEKKNDTPTITNLSQVDPPSETTNPFSPNNVDQKQEQGKGADKNQTATSLSSQNEEQEKKNDTPTITNLSQVNPPPETSNPFSPTNILVTIYIIHNIKGYCDTKLYS
ncbi:hypothetical protein XELAEV_18045755mg [Xenopus laevis]|uniref:Uncharacterized protein n=1 Tax=Xenopus laevis TaxID=8355 RepID=A0A974C1L9_XENLA|nr:hypothetical protein XELAEV_18045755mg [Xenopus laevis]